MSAHPEWFAPKGDTPAVLKILNSLTGKMDKFVPISGNQVKWYTCGPTVYDSAHLGHARAYITFDILRRILTDYFGYDVIYCMNITDLDDKIIIKARRNFFIAEYRKLTKDPAVVIKDVTKGFEHELKKQQEKIAEAEKELAEAEVKMKAAKGADKKKQMTLFVQSEVSADEQKLKLKVILKEQTSFEQACKETTEAKQNGDEAVQKLITAGNDVLSTALDRAQGSSFDNHKHHAIFRDHARKYENEFLADMKALGVRDADALTRVTEYVPQIITFVQQIIKNGYGYESNGSVYFNTVKFSEERAYPKLCPFNAGNIKSQQDAEGSLSSDTGSEKRNGTDFALWKRSKPGEPVWPSPWGEGRPGWHIECSAMATDILGDNIDIHSGGEDLKFPHHDNELAQSEAHSGCKQWVNYFLHAGHLNIAGLKMSKSLKNFKTIKEVLECHTGRQIRILFLLAGWDKKMQYNKASLTEAANVESKFREFFINIRTAVRTMGSIGSLNQEWTPSERKLHDKLLETQTQVHTSLCNNFDYPSSMRAIQDLIGAVNKYLSSTKQHKTLLLTRIAEFVDTKLRMFGVMGDTPFGFSAGTATANDDSKDKVIDAMTKFREMVKSSAGLGPKEIMMLCDSLRDDVLPELGIRLEDGSEGKSTWKMDDPVELIKKRDEKRKMERAKALQKLKNKVKALQKDLAKWTSAGTPAKVFFAAMDSTYSQFDVDGKPTHDAKTGQPLSKKGVKNAGKAFAKQEAAHTAYQKKKTKDKDFMTTLQTQLKQAQVNLAKFE